MAVRRKKNVSASSGGDQETNQPSPSPAIIDPADKALEVLTRTVSEKPDFPAFSANISELLGILEDPYLSVYDVSRVILRDVSLTTQILRVVNSIYFESYQHQVHTVSSAVMLLGFNYIRDLAIGLKLFENFQQSDFLEQTKQLILRSFFTAITAQELVHHDRRFEHEEIFITALLLDFGELIAAYYFPEEYRQVLNLIEKEDISKSAAARQVFKVSLEALGLGILKMWNLPQKFLGKLSRLKEEDLPHKSPEMRLRKLLTGVRGMAQCMVEPEFPKEKWQRQVDGLCRSLGLSSEKLAGSLKASAERFQELTRILGLPAPTEFAEHAGKKEAEPFQGEEGNNDSQVEPPISDQPSDTLDTEVHNLQFLLQVVEEIHQAIAAQSPIHQTIMMILEGIFRCIGFDRVVCCMVDPQRTLVSGRFGLGEKVEQLIPLLRAPLSSESNALTRAVRDRQDYVVDPGSRPEDRTLMEEDYWRGSDTQMFLVSPVHVGKTPVGALYADRCTSRHPITDPERQRFQSFRDLAVIAVRLSSTQGINS